MISENIKRKAALVTGTSKGIGYEVARQLAQQEGKFFIGSRDLERGQLRRVLRDERLGARMVKICKGAPSVFAET